MKRLCGKIMALSFLCLAYSCASFWSGESPENSPHETTSKVAGNQNAERRDTSVEPAKDSSTPGTQANIALNDPKQPVSSGDDMGLSQARLMGRMDEIESELKRQREKIRLLEQGLLTGIAPSALRSGYGSDDQPEIAQKSKDSKSVDGLLANYSGGTNTGLVAPDLDPQILPTTLPTTLSQQGNKEEQSQLDGMMSQAIKKYQASDFSGAMDEFATISRKFGPNSSEAALRFWIGKCYVGLKEYSTARGEFESYLSRAPSGVHVAEARLELAKTLNKLGLRERARNELQRVIKEFEGQEPAEIATYELGVMQGAL